MFFSAPYPELLQVQLVLVELLAEKAVLLMKDIDGLALLHSHLRVVLHL